MRDKFYKIYIHHEHLLFLDWLLNHVPKLTNMTKSVELSKELKEATSQALKKVPRIFEIQIDDSDYD